MNSKWYWILFSIICSSKNNSINNSIIHAIGVKIGIIYVFSHRYDSCDSLPLEETFTFHKVIMDIKSALNEDLNHYYQNLFLENCSYQSAKN